MARIRCSGGIVLDAGQRAWLAEDPGDEVRDWRTFQAAPVAVGPQDASADEVESARSEVRRLLEAGGPLVAAAGVDLGGGFRSARLDGGGESRRDAVLAAVEVLGIGGLPRLGERAGVLVALFGTRATRRVGATALEAIGGADHSSLRLAVAASDLLHPEQLEGVLRWSATLPKGVEPVPREGADQLAERLHAVLAPFTPQRRLALLRSLWDAVAGWHRSAQARVRASRRQLRPARLNSWRREIALENDRWWRAQAHPAIGDRPTRAAMLAWVPTEFVWRPAMERAFQECIAATALLRTAMAAEDQPVEAAVLAHVDQLAYAATAHLRDVPDRIEALRSLEGRPRPAGHRAATVAQTTLLATDPAGDRAPRAAPLAHQLRDACELAHAVLSSGLELITAAQRWGGEVPTTPALAEWRAVAGYGPRDPHFWTVRELGPDDRLSLAARLEAHPADPATAELIDDGLWLADLADTIATWYGHDEAAVAWFGPDGVDVDPPPVPPDPSLPLLESVPLAVSGAAQLVSLGATAPRRPASWEALTAALVESAAALGFGDEFAVAGELAAWDGHELPGTALTIEVARTARQLAEWGNFMGNCIATYADDAKESYALVALRDQTGRLAANIAVIRAGSRWKVEQALARFNQPLDGAVAYAIRSWVEGIRVPSPSVPRPARAGAPARRTARARRGRRPATARERLARAASDLGDAIGDLDESPELAAAEPVLRPIATALGWAGGAGDRQGLFVAIARPRRAGPLAAAVAGALAEGHALADLWEATSFRPLATAVGRIGAVPVDLRRLADMTVPPSLRPALQEPRLRAARVVDLAGRRIRAALGELLDTGDAALDRAVVDAPHVAFLAGAVLAITAAPVRRMSVTPLPVASDGTVAGRPRSSLLDRSGPWTDARPAATELGTSAAAVDRVLAGAPGGELYVPSAWLVPRGWTALWARAYRTTRRVSRAARGGPTPAE